MPALCGYFVHVCSMYVCSSPLGVTMTGLMNRKMKKPPMRDWQYSGDASGNFSYVHTYKHTVLHRHTYTSAHTNNTQPLSTQHTTSLHTVPNSTLPHTSHPTVHTSRTPLHTAQGTLHLHKHTNSFAEPAYAVGHILQGLLQPAEDS